MSYRIETRLALIVSAVAVCAVVATALAIRQGARSELSRVGVFTRSTAQAVSPARVAEVARALAGRCCVPGGGAQFASLLEENQVALVYAADSDRLLVRFERLQGRAPHLDLKRAPNGLTISANVGTDFAIRQVRLSVAGSGAPVRLADGATGALYVFGLPLPEERARTTTFLTALDKRVLQIAVLAALIAVALTWIAARRIANPLRELDRAVRDVGEGNLERRVNVSGAGEIALLEQRFNAMAEELGRQQQLRRNLASDVAHELRAPLTALRCRIESMVRWPDSELACDARLTPGRARPPRTTGRRLAGFGSRRGARDPTSACAHPGRSAASICRSRRGSRRGCTCAARCPADG